MSVYNEGVALKGAIESILNQTYSDFEFIIVDDGSNDGSEEELRRYEKLDKRIKLVRQKNSGLTVSLNKGLEFAQGLYIARQDGDDISYPNRLEEQMRFMEENTNVVLSATDVQIIDDCGDSVVQVRNSCKKYLKRRMRITNQLVHGSYMFKRIINGTAVQYNSFYKKSQDYDLALRMIEIGQIAIVPKVLYKWRLSESGIAAGNVNFYGDRALKNDRLRRANKIEDYSAPKQAEIETKPSKWSFLISKGDYCLSGYSRIIARTMYKMALENSDIDTKARKYCNRRIMITYFPKFMLKIIREYF